MRKRHQTFKHSKFSLYFLRREVLHSFQLAANKELSLSPLLLRALEPGIQQPLLRSVSWVAHWQGKLAMTRQWQFASFSNSCQSHSCGAMQLFSTTAAHQILKQEETEWGGEEGNEIVPNRLYPTLRCFLLLWQCYSNSFRRMISPLSTSLVIQPSSHWERPVQKL